MQLGSVCLPPIVNQQAKFVKANLAGSVAVSDYNASCTGGAHRGKVMGQPFLIITSGIGPMQAQSCVQLAMTICPSETKEFLKNKKFDVQL